ncbi:MAG TPA: type VI secretion system baseplate subunit TssE [Thiomicrorhabdus sp.]|nr:type VI secretion system baseplate subunit TssE [Thiomicrorhabdus sp.]
MAGLITQECLQPSLLDRLTDDEPEQTQETRNKRILSIRQLRSCVIRDLAWLLNTGNMEETTVLDNFPHIKNSVLNYGMRGLTGYTVSTLNAHEIERQLRQAILDFEPRILKKSIRVRMCVDDNKMNHNAVKFEIEGDLWAQPIPLRLFLKTEVDLEVGSIKISESGSQKIS